MRPPLEQPWLPYYVTIFPESVKLCIRIGCFFLFRPAADKIWHITCESHWYSSLKVIFQQFILNGVSVKVLYVGTETHADECCGWILEKYPASVSTCLDPAEFPYGLAIDEPDLILIDLRRGVFQLGLTLSQARKLFPNTPSLIISPSDQVEDAVFAFQLGAVDYIRVPVDKLVFQEKIHRINSTYLSADAIASPNQNSSARADDIEDIPEHLLFGSSPLMQNFRQIVQNIRETDLPVLITGESGTGKERTAKYIWKQSSRKNKPFIKVNCAAIPGELLESELFGFEKGAFTGAYKRKPGKFEAANGGILFLDEITDLPLTLQSKLLHVLRDGRLSTLGSSYDLSVDVRVMAATNNVIEDSVSEGTFRRDLYYRVNVVRLHVPALRDRPEQIAKLIDHFRMRFSSFYSKPALNLDDGTLARLHSYSWPGNIRELENVIRRATVMGVEKALPPEILGAEGTNETAPSEKTASPERAAGKDSTGNSDPINAAVGAGRSLKEIAKSASLEAERAAIARVLNQTKWNRKQAAKILEISYKTLLTKIKETGLDHA